MIAKHILVISEDMILCHEIRKKMQDNVTDVCCMASPMESLASYMKNDYCLVILDTTTPKIHNFELLCTIHNAKHVPILAITNSAHPEEKVALYHAGADCCIEKPINLDICVAQAKVFIDLYINKDINDEQQKPVFHGTDIIIIPRYRQVTV